MDASNGYNLIVKAVNVGDAMTYVNEHLSIPATAAAPLGYGEVMVSVHTDDDLSARLNEWLTTTRPDAQDPFPPGALIWWKS